MGAGRKAQCVDNLFRHPGQSSLPFLLALTFPTQSLPVSYTHLVFDCAEGTLYVEFCPDCQIISMQHQQT